MTSGTLPGGVPTDRRDPAEAESGLRHPPLTGRIMATFVLAYVVLTAAVAGLGFLVVDGLDGTALSRLDDRVTDWFVEQRTRAWTTWTDVGSTLADTATVVIGTAVVSIVSLVVWRRWHETVLVGGALVLETTVFVTAAKLVGRDRPDVEQLDVSPPTSGFPSGHQGAAVAFFVTLAIVVAWHTRNALIRSAMVVLAVLAVVSVGLSRLYRGMHYLTDVVVGGLLGLAAVVVVYALVRAGTTHLAHKRDAGDLRVPLHATRLSTVDR